MESIPSLPPYQEFIPRFLSYVPGRRVFRKFPGFKQHTNIGHAKNAILNATSGYPTAATRHRMAIWEFDFSTHTWNIVYDIPAGTRVDNLPWRKP
jgi:hypothetical protein